jgi:DNA recombination protein RmuC
VPAEGLYAEILRRPGFFEYLQQTYRVTIVGPTNLVAFLSSLQMGFRTLAIEQRSAEVWEILGAVKMEFGKFNEVLEKVKRNLEGGIKNIDEAVGARSRAIERKLKTVQQLPQENGMQLLNETADYEENAD